ncbi:hypothetical protein LB507_003634 [Fusarium sp. FIESC RH6]|nr:hypothetical protein LB507_003634 [Fusarium sp. FIESC RH6]
MAANVFRAETGILEFSLEYDQAVALWLEYQVNTDPVLASQ